MSWFVAWKARTRVRYLNLQGAQEQLKFLLGPKTSSSYKTEDMMRDSDSNEEENKSVLFLFYSNTGLYSDMTWRDHKQEWREHINKKKRKVSKRLGLWVRGG